MRERKKIGNISVDAGLCWLGDPCYLQGNESRYLQGNEETLEQRGFFEDWGRFCRILDARDKAQAKPGPTKQTFGFDPATDFAGEGMGVAVSTGNGDGSYPVYITESDDGRIASVTVQFIREEK